MIAFAVSVRLFEAKVMIIFKNIYYDFNVRAEKKAIKETTVSEVQEN